MKGFRSRASVAELSTWIAGRIKALSSEDVSFRESCGRVLANDVVATEAVPAFDRSAMGGYAVRAEKTFGASDYMPAPLRCVGKSRPGRSCEAAIGTGEAIEVATGAPLPRGADSVVPVEATRLDGETVLITEAVPRGRHVSRCGEDFTPGALVQCAGRILRPQDLGVLSAVAADRLAVVRRRRIVVLITGDELLAPGTPARDFKVPDVNSVILADLFARDGGLCEVARPLPDHRTVIRDAIVDAASRADLVVVSGGSSAGPEDHVPGIIAELGRLIVHGLALRPASPTGVGLILAEELPVVMLPGNPVSCLCGYDFVAGPIIRRLAGRPAQWPYRSVYLPLATKLSSVVGRVGYARVRTRSDRVEPLSTSGASILSSVSRADGFVVIPAGPEGYPVGASVEVWCYDEHPGENAASDEFHFRSSINHDQSIRSAHQIPAG
jgi:molybdopterin molybdotransferase